MSPLHLQHVLPPIKPDELCPRRRPLHSAVHSHERLVQVRFGCLKHPFGYPVTNLEGVVLDALHDGDGEGRRFEVRLEAAALLAPLWIELRVDGGRNDFEDLFAKTRPWPPAARAS
jgi:hypothetical protein